MRRLGFLFILAAFCSEKALATACPISLDEPLKICFDADALEFDRCSKSFTVHFQVGKVSPDLHYRYSFKVFREGKDLDIPVILYNSFPFKDDVPPVLPTFAFAGNGVYKVEVTVTAEDGESKTEPYESKKPLTYTPYTYAIVVGISKYNKGTDDRSDVTRIHNLSFASQDAKDFADLLKSAIPGEELKLTPMLDGEATSLNVEHAIRSLTGKACGSDQLIFYFSGHGIVDKRGYRYVATADTDVSDLGNTTEFYIPLISLLLQIPVKMVIILDSCFSGFTVVDSASNGPPEGKLQYTDGKQFLSPFPVPQGSADLREARGLIENFSHPITAYAAATSNTVAEEVYRVTKNDGAREVYFYKELKPGWPTTNGHGLYTYFFLSGLRAELASEQPPGCVLKTDAAFRFVKNSLDNLSKALSKDLPQGAPSKTLQIPDEMHNTDPVLEVKCDSASKNPGQ
jgi:hypothetical protein